MEQIKVLIVDDEPLIRNALGTMLATDPGIAMAGSADNGRKAVQFCQEHPVDVVLMDLQMPVMNGVEATREITALPQAPVVLAITAFSADDFLVPVLTAGASGYLVKDSEPEDILHAVHAVHQGIAAISPSVSADVVSAVRSAYHQPLKSASELAEDLGMTAREVQILKLVARGLNNPEISRQLAITEATVKSHMANIFSKLEVRDRVQALIEATKLGLVDISRP